MSVSEFRHPNGDQALPQILIHTKDSSTLEERPLGDGSEELGPGLSRVGLGQRAFSDVDCNVFAKHFCRLVKETD